jgi:eukaryotic-like serine/threonine-protein kinase
MSSAASGCLSEDQALAYVRAMVGAETREWVEQHIDDCADCRWLISELARGSRAESGPVAPLGAHEGGLERGQRIGRFIVGDRLGSGAMGVVHSAYDPELDRQVALKVLAPEVAGNEQARVRLLTEARAMARLAHPGVVPIHDVEIVGDVVVLAMELVEGPDARRWLETSRPSWQEALAVLLPAGRGLAAAHAAGIVHRDVKPSNVLIGRDGRARITDFGLARAQPRDAEPVDPGAPSPDAPGLLSPSMTASGALLGTPAYMAPEQHGGRPADPSSDQFSFSLVLHEAVYGERPFQPAPDLGRTPREALTAAVVAGRVRPAPPGSRVPRWLRKIVLRGLAIEPGDRWPSLSAMLDALEATPRRRRRRWAIASGVGAALALALSVGVVVSGVEREDRLCTGAAAELERTWPATERATALAHIAAMSPYGRVGAQRLGEGLREHAARWTAGHREACVAHRRGEQSSELLDRRMACLERSRAALAAVTEVLQTADDNALPEALVAAGSLPDPSACSDIAALVGRVPPLPREMAARAAAMGAALERAQIYLAAGRAVEARDQSAAAVREARALGYRPLLARALLAEGHAGMELDDRPAAAPPLAEAAAIAIEVGDDPLAVEAWARAAWVKGTTGKDPDAALAGLDLIEALARRERSPSFARALLWNNVGAVAFSHGRREDARERFARADDEARAVAVTRVTTGARALELISIRANAAMSVEDPDERDALLGNAHAELARVVGPDHPRALRLQLTRARLIPGLVGARERLTSACDTYQRFHGVRLARLAIECWSELGFVAAELGEQAAALAAVAHAAALPATESASLEAGGYLALWRGDARAAAAHFSRALEASPADADQIWWLRFERGKLSLGLGRALAGSGDARGAAAALQRAVIDLIEVKRMQPAATVERRLARGRAELAKVLIASHGDRARIADVAREAATALRLEGASESEIAALERAAAPLPDESQ